MLTESLPKTDTVQRCCTIRKILVAADHEKHPALKMATSLAQVLGAEICVIYVIEPIVIGAEDAFMYTQSLEVQQQNAKLLLQDIKATLPPATAPLTDLREGNAAQAIVCAAREWPADLIIMGTHRRNAIARALLGSTSQGVLRHAPCPLLLVDDHAVEPSPS